MNYKDKRYYSANSFFKDKFGEKIIKIPLDGNFTCPNRDGYLSDKGCIFCSTYGSGEFAGSRNLTITEQFKQVRESLSYKWKNGKYMAYFQAFTNTYAPIEILRKKYLEAINQENVVAISIATRPDCIDDEVINLLCEINKKVYVCVELGVQTSKNESVKFINRCYENQVFESCMKKLKDKKIDVISHVILGLPNETKEDMINTVRYMVKNGIDGIKLQLLHIIKNTGLENFYYENHFKILTMEEYIDIVVSIIEILPENIVIHRITGDGDRNTLIEPLWSLNKKSVLNAINYEFVKRDTFQGKFK